MTNPNQTLTATERLILAQTADRMADEIDNNPDDELAGFQHILRDRALQLRAKATKCTPIRKNGTIIGAITRAPGSGWKALIINKAGTGYEPIGYGLHTSEATPTQADQVVRAEYTHMVRMGDRPALA